MSLMSLSMLLLLSVLRLTGALRLAQEPETVASLAKHLSDVSESYEGKPFKQRLRPSTAFVLYKQMHLVQEILAGKQVAIWATSGTLLGAIRNNGIIPHDNDGDFTIFEKDLEIMKEALLSAGMTVERHVGNFYQVHYTDINGDIVPVSGYTDEHGHTRTRNDIYIAEWFKDVYHPRDDVYNVTVALSGQVGDAAAQLSFVKSLEPVKFGCSTVLVPKNRTIVQLSLDRSYDKGWKTNVDCSGTQHDCSLSEDGDLDLHGMATPCFEGNIDYRII